MFSIYFRNMKKITETRSKFVTNKEVSRKFMEYINNGNYNNAINFLKSNGFGVTGAGQYKVVFSLGSKKVLKVARNTLGVTDIENEIHAAECAPNLFPTVYKSGHGWAIVERIKTTLKQNKAIGFEALNWFEINLDELNSLSSEPNRFKGFFDIIQWVRSYRNHKRYGIEEYKNILRYLLSKPKFKQFLTDVTNCKIPLTDMHLNNFGFKANGDFAILDLSFYEGSYEIDF